MDSQTIISYVLGAISGLALAVLKTVPKIVEDMWTDYRESRQRIKLDKSSIVSQLLFDIPRGKAQSFFVTTVKRSEEEQVVARISKYDKEMAKKVQSFLVLWRHCATSKQAIDVNGEVILMTDDEPVSKGPQYIEELLERLYKEYDVIIDLLNEWKR